MLQMYRLCLEGVRPDGQVQDEMEQTVDRAARTKQFT
jgi:hypothetical protein